MFIGKCLDLWLDRDRGFESVWERERDCDRDSELMLLFGSYKKSFFVLMDVD